MHFSTLLNALATFSLTSAHPLTPRDSTAGGGLDLDLDLDTPAFPIHSSCNATQRHQLTVALSETVTLAEAAKVHLLKHGRESPIFQKYFGNGTTATPLGWYERVISADRGNMTFRCDDPDKNCATQQGWAGHWRGFNATSETVICDLSYHRRLYLPSMCTRGYTISASAQNIFWATDLLHRVLHVPQISEGIVDHFAADYSEAVALAEVDSEKAGIDSDVLQFFAVEVYAFDVAVPGVGCVGDGKTETNGSATATATTTTTTTTTPSVESSATTSAKTVSFWGLIVAGLALMV